MSDSKITMIGLYKASSHYGQDLFELLNLPEGIDKDTVVANILQTSAEFEVMYPDAEYVHDSIKFWSRKWFWTFNKWLKLINTEYDPLFNYDRTEEWTDNNTHSDDDTINSKRKGTGDSNSSANGSTASHAEGSSSTSDVMTSNVETTKSAFDSSGYSPYENVATNSNEQIGTHSSDNGTVTTSDSSTSHSSSSDDYDETKKNEGQFENVHKGRMYGNIGVMSSQDMFMQEVDVAMFNLYDRIADIFIQEYCIPVYI